MIEPTVGRIVHFRPGKSASNLRIQCDPKQPLAAIVTYVHGPRMVNLAVLDALGRHHALASVRLLQDDDKGSDDEPFAEWMPFQKGQAAKTEAAAIAPARAITDNDLESGAFLSFGVAIAWLKTGARVARKGWNGKGMWLALVEGPNWGFGGTAPYDYPGAPHVSHASFIGMKTADDKFVPWLASQSDMLAEDWHVVE